MPCSECLRRAELLEQAEALLRDKRFKYGHHAAPTRNRLLEPYGHAVAQARENVEHHRAEHERESR